VVDNFSGRQRVRAAIRKHRLVQSDPLLIRRLGARTWLLVRDEKHEHSSIGSVANISIGMLAHLVVTLAGACDFADDRLQSPCSEQWIVVGR